MCQKCVDDYNWCAAYRTTNDFSKKQPNDPDYFGTDEWNFVKTFGGDMHRNFQQMRHLKSTTTGTTKLLHWLLQGELQARLTRRAPSTTGIGTGSAVKDQRVKMGADFGVPHSMKSGKTKIGAELEKAYTKQHRLKIGTELEKAYTKRHGLKIGTEHEDSRGWINIDANHEGAYTTRGGQLKMGAEFEDPYTMRDGRWIKIGAQHKAHHMRKETAVPPIPLTACFDENGHWMPCGIWSEAHEMFGSGMPDAHFTFPGFTNWHALADGDQQTGAARRAPLHGGLYGPYKNSKMPFRFSAARAAFDHKRLSTFMSKTQRAHEKQQFNALVNNLTSLYANINGPVSAERASEIELDEENIYRYYGSVAEALDEKLSVIKKLNFSELIELLKKEKQTRFEPVLFHEPFDEDKPWTWMSTFPKVIPEKYLQRLSETALAALQDWQRKQQIAKPTKRKRK